MLYGPAAAPAAAAAMAASVMVLCGLWCRLVIQDQQRQKQLWHQQQRHQHR
jgi:hypothetical protein